MTDRNYLFMTMIAPIVLVVAGVAAVVWPNYRAVREHAREVAVLQQKIDARGQLEAELDAMRSRHAALTASINTDLKLIPQEKEFTSLIKRLSLPVDGHTIVEREINMGNSTSAVIGQDAREQSLPLTVEMTADFESIFQLLQIAESMDRLIRTSSVLIQTDTDQQGQSVNSGESGQERPLLLATLAFHVIYDGGAEAQGTSQ